MFLRSFIIVGSELLLFMAVEFLFNMFVDFFLRVSQFIGDLLIFLLEQLDKFLILE